MSSPHFAELCTDVHRFPCARAFASVRGLCSWPPSTLEMSRSELPVFTNRVHDTCGKSRVGINDRSPPLVSLAFAHAPPEQRPVFDWEQGGLVSPVLEQPARFQQSRDGFGFHGTGPRAQNKQMAPFHRSYGIELDARQPPYDCEDLFRVRSAVAVSRRRW